MDWFSKLFKELNVDIFFMGANGVSMKKGATTPQLDTALLKERIIENSKQRILLTDSSKLENVSFAKFADLSRTNMRTWRSSNNFVTRALR